MGWFIWLFIIDYMRFLGFCWGGQGGGRRKGRRRGREERGRGRRRGEKKENENKGGENIEDIELEEISISHSPISTPQSTPPPFPHLHLFFLFLFFLFFLFFFFFLSLSPFFLGPQSPSFGRGVVCTPHGCSHGRQRIRFLPPSLPLFSPPPPPPFSPPFPPFPPFFSLFSHHPSSSFHSLSPPLSPPALQLLRAGASLISPQKVDKPLYMLLVHFLCGRVLGCLWWRGKVDWWRKDCKVCGDALLSMYWGIFEV